MLTDAAWTHLLRAGKLLPDLEPSEANISPRLDTPPALSLHYQGHFSDLNPDLPPEVLSALTIEEIV